MSEFKKFKVGDLDGTRENLDSEIEDLTALSLAINSGNLSTTMLFWFVNVCS